MAGRPPKESIDFAGWNTDIFDSDKKIDKLLESQGCVGFTIYFFLCQRAYGSNGYFYPWCYDDSATTARKIGGGAGAKSVEETVRYCLQIGLFNQRLFDEWNILTSRGIQKRYMQVALTRTYKTVIMDYWLLTKEESDGLDFRAINPNYPSAKSDYDPAKLNYAGSKVKDSIVQDSKGTPLDPPGGGDTKTGHNKSDKKELREVWESYEFCSSVKKALTSWIQYKTERRSGYKPRGLNSLLSQAKKHTAQHGETAVIDLIEISMANNWQGIAWDRLKGDGNAANQSADSRGTGKSVPKYGNVL